MSRDEFRDSVGFAAGVSYERRRIGEVIRKRIATLLPFAAEPVTILLQLSPFTARGPIL